MVEDFKKSDEFVALKVEYTLGSYQYAFKHAWTFLRTRLPDIQLVNLQPKPEITDGLELLTSNGTMVEDEANHEDEE